ELCSLPVSLVCYGLGPLLHPDSIHPLKLGELAHIPPKWRPDRACKLFRAATVCHVDEKGKDREVEGCVRKDGDAQKPAKRPREGLAHFRRDEFGQLQARGKKT